jgi:hypothetical protein
MRIDHHRPVGGNVQACIEGGDGYAGEGYQRGLYARQ